MPWNYIRGKFVFVPTSTSTSQPTIGGGGGDEVRISGPPDLQLGSWVAYTGIPSTTVGTFKHYDIENAHSHLELATEGSRLVAGIVSGGNMTSGYELQQSGVCLAWVLPSTKRLLPLSGVYERSVNGIYKNKVVVAFNPRDNSFTLAETRDSELQELKERFDALTNS